MRRGALAGPRAGLLLGLSVCALGATALEPAPAAGSTIGEWNFSALLDGRPIGQHRFTVNTRGDTRQVTSEASFAVKFLGVTAYRYRHKATEQWRGGCLTSLVAETDDDGTTETVRAAQNDALLQGCIMSFAYWNPAIQAQTRLLNAQTGKLETVQVRRGASASIEVRGKPVEATEFRISGPAQPISVWYTGQGEWIGLDSVVGGGRKLSYRLQ